MTFTLDWLTIKHVIENHNIKGNRMQGLIILDGPDCAGKTTLATALQARAQELGGVAPIHHLGKPPEDECWRLHSEALCRYVLEAFTEHHVVIADRHFMSEGIYGDVYRTGSEYPFASRHVDRALHRFRALRVICAPESWYVTKKLEEMKKVRHEEFHDKMDEVCNRYRALWFGAPDKGMPLQPDRDYLQQLTDEGGVSERLGWYHYDVQQHGHDLKAFSSLLLQELADEVALVPEEMLDPHDWRFTGFPAEDSVLFVADRINAENPLNLPFFANSASSLFLAKAFHKLHLDESKVVIANIHDKGGLDTVRGLQQMCGRTIVMGRDAERTMRTYGIAFDAAVRHPQHAARFNRFDQSYVNELEQALGGWAGARS